MGAYEPNAIIRYPSGKYGFVGSVDARLAYEPHDDLAEQVKTARRFGLQFSTLQRRVFDSAEDAAEAANTLGVPYRIA